MSCCKDKKLSLFLPKHFSLDENKEKLQEIMGWSRFQTQTIIDEIEHLKDYLIFEGNRDECSELSMKLAKASISHYLIDPSLQK